jgi:hypothetical protein
LAPLTCSKDGGSGDDNDDNDDGFMRLQHDFKFRVHEYRMNG